MATVAVEKKLHKETTFMTPPTLSIVPGLPPLLESGYSQFSQLHSAITTLRHLFALAPPHFQIAFSAGKSLLCRAETWWLCHM